MKYAGTNWTTTVQVAKSAQQNGLNYKTQQKKTMLNKKLIWRAASNIQSDKFGMKELLKEISAEVSQVKTIDQDSLNIYGHKDILNIVTSVTGITAEKLKSRSRKRYLVDIRHVAMYLIHKYTYLSASKTGELFDRDHATALHGKKRVNEAKKGYNPELNKIIEACERVLALEDVKIAKNDGTCNDYHCTRPTHAKGYCTKHYQIARD